MNEEEVREQCVKLAELSGRLLREKEELEEIAHDQSREIFEYKTIIAGAQKKEELLLDYIDNISSIIAYQCSLKDQDLWMADMIREGLYNPDDELLDILIEDGRYRYEKPKKVD